MANQILTDSIIAKRGLALLENNCVMPGLVYRAYEEIWARKVGDSFQIKKPARIKVSSSSLLAVQPMVDETVTMTADQTANFGLQFTQKDRTLSIQDFESRYLRSGIVNLANAIDRSVCTTLKNIAVSSGTPGTTPSTYEAWVNAYAKQTMLGVPDDGLRRAVVNPITHAGVSNACRTIYNDQMAKEIHLKGYMWDLAGYSFHNTQNLPTHTVGALGGTPLVNGASQTGSSLITDGWTAAAATRLKQGDVFTIAGVYAVNPQTYENSGYLQQFVCQADAASDGSGNLTVSIYPAINDGTLTTTNSAGQTVSLAAYQNVTNAPANNAALTIVGTASTAYRQDYVFHRDAVALAMVNLLPPETAVVKESVRSEKTGLSMMMTGGYDVTSGQSTYRVEGVWATSAIYPELALRMWGGSPE